MSIKSEKMYDGITNIDDELIEAAQDDAAKSKKPAKWLPWAGIAAAACLGLGVGAAALSGVFGKIPVSGGYKTGTGISAGNAAAKLIAKAEYPEVPPYPEDNYSDWDEYDRKYKAWADTLSKLRNQPEGYTDGTDKFFTSSIKTILAGNGGNRVYSPLSLFMALGMSAEITDGNTRKQILDLLGQDSIESLRSHANSIWLANYMDDGMAKCVLANSVWLNNNISYSQDVMNRLCIDYYASSYSGEPGNEEYNKLFQDWLNEQTDGLLENYVENIRLDPEMVMTLVSTVDYAGKWIYPFSADNTKSGTFHSPGGDVTCDFMNKEFDQSYFWGEKFSSIMMNLENNGAMKLILPDEGITPEELLNDDETIEFLMTKNYDWKNNKYCMVNMSVPKFDVSSEIDLVEQMNKLGVTDISDGSVSDFSPLSPDGGSGVFLSKATQAARVEIDEEGCRAAALTVMEYCGAAMPDGKADFILDRPFIFEITGTTGLPLFVGIVNNPVQ